MPYVYLYDGSTFLAELFDSSSDGPHPVGTRTNLITGQAGNRTFSISLSASSFASVPVVSQQNDRVTGTITLHFGFPPKSNQTISFQAVSDQVVNGRVTLSATASSGLPVSFTATAPGQITAGTNLTFTGTGQVSVVASQAGNAEWNPAPNVTNSFNVTSPPPPPPTGISATDGIYTDKVRVAWNAVAGATSYQVWQNTAGNYSSAKKIGTTAATNYDDMSAGAQTTYYYWIKAVNAGGSSAFSAPDTGYPGVTGPLVSVNGLIGDNVNVAAGTPLTIAVEMMNLPADYIGVNVDWWVAAFAHNGGLWYYLDNAMVWAGFDGNPANMHPVYQGPLNNLPPAMVAQGLTLSSGTYNIWFAVDYPMDGSLHLDGTTLLSRVTVLVQ
ncbi:MAG: hypothetical protein LC725_04555 [Lentisphaerae bacterium]|nr:hypothetical protein [Lentisphaerota bacterium]